MDEFAFEITLCAQLEAAGHLVSRQLGTGVINPGHRIADIITVTPTAEFDARKRITPEEIPTSAIEANVGPGRYRYWKNAYHPLDIHPEQARESMERAVSIGFFERTRRNGRTYIRQTTRYPSWIDSICVIENKPNLDRPGNLESQLRNDVSLAVVDEVILATQTHVTRAHRNRIPTEVGIWEVTDTEITEIRDPTRLPVSSRGIERLDQHPGRTDITTISSEEKSRKRRRLGERVYGKGWRTYTMSECQSFTTKTHNPTASTKKPDRVAGIPHCTHYDRIIDPGRECGSTCPYYHPSESPHSVDLAAVREATSPWTRSSEPLTTKQTHLTTFTSDPRNNE